MTATNCELWRCPGCRGSYQCHRLGDIAEVVVGGVPSVKNDDYWGGDIPFINVSDMKTKYIVGGARTVTQAALTAPKCRPKLVPADTVLISLKGVNVAKPAIVKVAVAIPHTCADIKLQPGFDPEYLYYWFRRNAWDIYQLAYGSVVSILNKSVVEDLRISFPDLAEQQKIGACLASIDHVIDLLTRKVRWFEQHLTGRRQKLYDQKIRFEGFTKPWQEHRLGDIAEVVVGDIPSVKNDKYWGGDIPFIDVSAMKTKYISSTAKTVTPAALKASVSRTRLVPANTVLMSIVGTIGKPAITKMKAAISRSCTGIKLQPGYNPEYVYYWIRRHHRLITGLQVGSSQKRLRMSDIRDLRIFFPDPAEQHKIVTYLSALDEYHRLITAQIETYKKGRKFILNRLLIHERL